jgi:hypothetical protein
MASTVFPGDAVRFRTKKLIYFNGFAVKFAAVVANRTSPQTVNKKGATGHVG